MALQADLASPEHKEWLARALFYLRKPTTGSLESDILQLSNEIRGCVAYIVYTSTAWTLIGASDDRLVDRLDLHSTLAQYRVPREDIPQIAKDALRGGFNDLVGAKVISLLEKVFE